MFAIFLFYCRVSSVGRGYGGRDAAGFRSMCGLKFCSMSYPSRVDEYNKEVHGLEKKDYSGLVEKLVTVR